MYKRSIFWFRQDLRVEDNTGLMEAFSKSEKILPIFIFDQNILSNICHKDKRLNFLISAIKNLEKSIGTEILAQYGDPIKIISNLIKQYEIDAIFLNKSYGFFGKQRDYEIKKYCNQIGVHFLASNDFLLVEPEIIEKKKVFTPYYKHWKKIAEGLEINNGKLKIKNKIINLKKSNELIFQEITRKYGSNESPQIFNPLIFQSFNNLKTSKICTYHDTRNNLEIDGTTRLSPYIRFGILSIRQIFKYANSLPCAEKEVFIKELAWRDFWNHIAHHFPESNFLEFQEKRRGIKWENNEKKFKAWCDGKTGFPIIDAAMKQLKQENWMHGRARMIVASFLTKNLHIDRRWGEKHFAKYLLDYDSNVNIGNWQWSAGVGADPKPLRIFNPILQTKKFDPNCAYIKKYIPQLKDFTPKDIIENPWKLGYIKPIVDLKESANNFKEIYYCNLAIKN